MTLNVGDRLPQVKLMRMADSGPVPIDTDELFGGKRVVVFAVPGAFTPTCSARHLPGFVEYASEIRRKGVDTIVCVSVNDAFVMDAWGRHQSVGAAVLMAADGNGDFTRAVGLEEDRRSMGMGIRSRRFAMVVDDGVVSHLFIENPGEFSVSKAEKIVEVL